MADNELLLKIGIQSDLRSLSSINSEFKKLEQGVKNLNKSMKNGGKSLDDYKNKSAMLQRQIELNTEKMNRLKTRISDTKQKMEDYQKQIEKLSTSEGDNSKAIENLTKKYQTAAGDLNKAEVELRSVQESTKKLTEELENNNRAVNNFNLQHLSDKAKEAGEHLEKLGEKVNKAGEEISKVGQGITNTFLPVATAGVLATQQAIAFESAWAGVLKTVNADEATLSKLQEGLVGISERAPVSANELFGLAEIAGQLGVEAPDIEKFVETISQLGVTTNISAEQGAQSLAQFLNITGSSTDVVDRLASAIVDCGNNFSTTENDILNLAMRLAGVGTTVGLTEAQIIGLSTAMSSLGITAEAGGTAISTVMSDIDSAVAQGGEKLDAFAKVAGMSGEQFKQAWEQDASQALVVFLDHLHALDESGADTTTVLSDLFGESSNIRDVMLRLAGNTKLVTEALNTSNNAWDENTALADEAAKRYETTASQMEIMKNKIQNIGVKIGQALLPAFNDLLGSVEKVVEWFGNLDPEVSATIIKFGTLATAVGIGTTAFGKFVGGVGNLLGTVGKVSKGIGAITDMTSKTGKAISTLSSMTTTAIPALSGLTTTASGGASALGLLTTAALPVAAALAAVAAGAYTYHEYSEAMNDTILKSTEEMSGLEEGFRKLKGVQSYSKEELEDLNLVYKDFNENISPDFQNRVEEMRDSIGKFNLDLSVINADGIFSEEEAERVQNNFNKAVEGSLENIKNKKEEVQKSWEETFVIDDGVIDESEQTLINFFNRNYDTSASEIESMQEEVNELFRKKREEGYQFTAEDEAKIREYYSKIHEIELQCLADNEEEQLYAKNLFQSQVATMDAEHASKLGQERKKSLEADLHETEAYYDTQIQLLTSKMGEMSEEERAAAEIELGQLKADKEAKVQAKREEINAIYDEIVAGNANLKGEIDRFSLEMFDGESKVQNDRLNKFKTHYDGLNEITTDGMYHMYNSETKAWDDVTVTVDEATGEITGMIRSYTDENGRHIEEVCGYNEEYKKSTQELANKMAQEYTKMSQNVKNNTDAYVDAFGNVINKNGEVIGSLEQVVDENGNLTTSIKDVNGNPIDISDNSQEAINHMTEVANSIGRVDGKTANTYIHTWYVDHHQGLYSGTQTGTGGKKYGYKNGVAGYWEQGTHGTLGSEQVAYVDELARKGRGWELVDGNVTVLGRDSIGTKILAGMGASVKSNVTSTGMMIKAVQEEVQKQLGDVYLEYGNRNSAESRLAFEFGQPQQNFFNNSNFDDSNLAGLLMTLIGAVQGQNMSPVINLDAKTIAKATYKYSDKFMERDLKRRY